MIDVRWASAVRLILGLSLLLPAVVWADGGAVSAEVAVGHVDSVRAMVVSLDELEIYHGAMAADSQIQIPAGGVVLEQNRRGVRVSLVRFPDVSDLRGLVDRARDLQKANPGGDVQILLYPPGQERNARNRHRLTRSVVVTLVEGADAESVRRTPSIVSWAAVPDHPGVYIAAAADTVGAFELARVLRQHPGAKRAVVLAGAPGSLQERLVRKQARTARVAARHDQPAEAQEFFALKRTPPGRTAVPTELYAPAREHVRLMPRYSTATRTATPSQAALGLTTREAESAVGGWTPLGPGNIGGRTRSLLIDPLTPTRMFAGGVAGGVWRTVNGGASWTPLTDLLANIAVASLAMAGGDPNVIYAGTGEGVFNGDAVRGAGIFKTTDGGNTWTHLAGTSGADFHYVNKIVISPNNGSRVYAATRTGVWRSVDGGTTWSRVVDPGAVQGCLDLAIRTDQATDYVFAACGTFAQATVYRKVDAENTGAWTAVLAEAGMGRTSLAIAASNQNVVYAVAASTQAGLLQDGLHAVYRSTSSGAAGTWTAQVRNTSSTKLNTVLLTNPVFAFLSECGFGTSEYFNQGWYDNVIAVDPVDANRVWVGGIDLFRSDDGGVTWGMGSHWWASAGNPRFAHADQHAIVFHPQYDGTTNKVMFVSNDGGVFQTADARAAVAVGTTAPCSTGNGSVNWGELNNNYGVTQFYHGLPYPDGLTYFGGTQDNGTLRGSDAQGSDGWSMIQGGDGGYVAVNPQNTNILYAEFTGSSITKSTNGGASFNPATNGIIGDGGFLFIAPFVMDAGNPNRLWTGGFYLWRTVDAAGTWARASAAVPAGSVSAVAVHATDGNRVMAGTASGHILRTTTGLTTGPGTTWANAQPRAGYVSSVAFDPASAAVAYATYSTFGGTHVWRSVDGGASWTGIDGAGATAIPDIPVHSIVVDPADSARLFVGTDLGVFSSIDGGATWSVENTGFANVISEWLVVGQRSGTPQVFAFTHGRGAWRVALPGSCTYSIAPTSAASPAGGGSGSVSVTAGEGCPWTAASNVEWITVTDGASGAGEGTVNYSVTANSGGARTGTVTIAEKTFTLQQAASVVLPNVSIAATDAAASEPTNTGTFTVSRTGATTAALTVNYTVGGTATAGSDYTALSGSVVIPAGKTSAAIAVKPVNDALIEDSETVVVSLAAGAGYTVGAPSAATVVIADNDKPKLTLTAMDATATEAGPTTGAFRVTRTGSKTAPLTVAYTVAGTATDGVDYQSLSGSVTIPAGATTATITVTPINDTLMESNETVVATLSANAAYVIGTPSSATVTITDNDLITVTISAPDATATEAGPSKGLFRVTRVGNKTAALTVAYTLGGTATNGVDYQSLSGSVTIPAGATTVTITVMPINDTLVEGNQTVVGTLSPSPSYVIGSPSSATITIVDND